ncbi:MAG: epoxyqueuosine reductase QueH [Fibrobacteraceae bacterium]|jgi:predicted adenine nucleotide alpha hydrolase (AANH) superfamily ATPase|nr:epoxyqueuosine reductase QueH [Fibrobacteraceae bacterium]MEE1067660.1 epoxyqueuosine reductase QueH [Fibrobacteraceae bacterium]
MRENYSQQLSKLIEKLQKEGRTPHLLLHACCAPCSSHCLEYLSKYFRITVFYYNPNISPKEEYTLRIEEIKRFVQEFKSENEITLIEGKYEPERFFQVVKGLEQEPEGGKRCEQCFKLRLSEAAKLAKELNADYYTTTLSISPLKNAELLNKIGKEEGDAIGVTHLPSDFKKKGGYARSIELSKEYNLYRQNFCGCVYSLQEAKAREAKRKESELL